LWLFGGQGYNDLWEFNPATGEWTWMSGANGGLFQPGVYGTLGSFAAGNVPGSRMSSVTWTDSQGNLWLFGGYGFDEAVVGYLNDLWEFNPSTKEWAWMGGSSTVGGGGQPGVYGVLGSPAAGNMPGGRSDAAGWVDKSNNFWLFGGLGYDSEGNYGVLNDLWKFDPAANDWTWVGGSSTMIHIDSLNDFGSWGNWGTEGVFAAGNIPGGRRDPSSFTDSSGNFWLFGGDGTDAFENYGFLNDLWEFKPSLGQWAWVSGSSAAVQNGIAGVYGTLGTPAAGNVPPARSLGLSWVDANGNLWLFGGYAFYSSVSDATLNDFWNFNPATSEWTWMGGANGLNCSELVAYCGVIGVYGTLGIPAAANIPGSREYASAWTDGNGNLWLFGGQGHDYEDDYGFLNDLWEYGPPKPASAPTFSIAAGTYASVQSVAITDATEGATIYYTTDGTTPTTSSTVYTGPITVSSTETIKAIASASELGTSTVASATYTLNLPPSFSMAASPSSLTVDAGSSGTTAVTVTPVNGFDSAVSFACSGLPAGATCSFSPATVTPPGTTSTTLTVTASSAAARLERRGVLVIPETGLAVAFCWLGWRKRRRWLVLVVLAVGLVSVGLVNGCGSGGSSGSGGGGGGGVQPVVSTVTVTATAGTLQQTATFTLTVN
jgi:N-acetylneuraminic acid mutarotase